jgi:PAS domain S-box-containing protein
MRRCSWSLSVLSFLRRFYDWVNPDRRSPWLRYGSAVLSVLAALAATLVTPQLRANTPLLFFFPAVLVSAVYGGLGPGLVAVVLTAAALVFWVLPGAGSPDSPGWQLVVAVAFVAVAAIIVVIVYALQRARTGLNTEREALEAALATISASEERFRVAQELSLDGFTLLQAVRGREGQIVDFTWQYINPAAEHILGQARAETEGQRLLQLLPGSQSNSELFARYVQVVETGQPHDLELAYDADGIQGWFRNMAVKLGDGVAVSFTDISDRKRYERQLSYQAFLLENVSDAVFAFDHNLHITLWNRGAEEMYGWTAAEAIGRHAAEVVRTAASAEEAKTNIAAVDSGQRRHFEAIHHNRAGDLLYIDSTATPLRDDDGGTTGFVVINRDMTARKRYEKELEQMNASLEQRVRARTAELERSNHELDQFAYVASHDLKAPLRAIALLAEWITEDATPVLSAQSLAHLDKLHGRVRRMEKLLNDLLDYSRAGRIRQEPELVDTGLLLTSVVELLDLPRGFTVVRPPAMPRLHTERVPLETVFRNLIQNACKHHNHPEHGCVMIKVEERPGEVQFGVADDGPGIAPEYHDRVFKLFQTLRPRDQIEASGMGLSVVKKTVESAGGRVWVESAEGRGAVFWFTWPHRSAGDTASETMN